MEDPSSIVLSGTRASDERLYKKFKASFGFLDVGQLTWESLNNDYSRMQWRSVLTAMEGSLEGFNMITLLRVHSQSCQTVG